MKTKIQAKLRFQSEKILHGLVLGTVIFSAALMSIGTIQIIQADTVSNTNVAQNVTAGTLAIDNAPSEITFNAGSPGTITTANTTTGGIVTNDTDGSGAGWTVTGFFNTNFYRNADGNVQMAIASRMYWGANNGSGGSTITNVTGTTGDAIGGANNNFPGVTSNSSLTLMTNNGINSGAGAFNMTNLKFNYNIPVTATTGSDYKTNLRLTIA